MITFRDVPLDDLGTVLDLTQGTGARWWNEFMDEVLAGRHTRRSLWDVSLETRGDMFQEFLQKRGLAPDVIIAPHPPGTTPQIVIRTQEAADVLNVYLEGATKVAP